MPVWRLQTSIWADSILPRDQFVMTPHFNDRGAATDPDGLCNDLAAAINGWMVGPGTRQIKVVAYDAQGTPPVFPQGEALLNANLSQNSAFPREIALCLSFYADRNRPRQRGRLYVPYVVASGTAPQLRPALAARQKVADLVPILSGLGGLDVDWCVYSRLDNQARKVTNWWVDDEWDTQRRRGLRPTTRESGSTGG